MGLTVSFSCAVILSAGFFFGAAIAAESGSNGLIAGGGAGGAMVEPLNNKNVAENNAGKRPEARSGAASASKAEEEGVDREVIERRNRMFILMLQILRAPK